MTMWYSWLFFTLVILMMNSSLTIPRTQEVAMLTNPDVKQWLRKQDVELIDYRDL